MAYTREQVIESGLRQGVKPSDIDAYLQRHNLGSYNPLLEPSTYKDLPSRALEDAKEIGRGMATLGGNIFNVSRQNVNEIRTSADPLGKLKEKFLNAVNDPTVRRVATGSVVGGTAGSVIPGLGTVGGVITGGLLAGVGPKNLADAYLSTYNTSVDDILGGKTKGVDVLYGALNKPVSAGLDLLSIPGVSKATSKVINKGVGSIPKTQFMKELFPDESMRKFNRELTNALQSSKANQEKFYQGYNLLQSTPYARREEIIKDIIANEGGLTKEEENISKLLKGGISNIEDELIKRGHLNPATAKQNKIAQYVMYKVGNNIQGVVQKDIDDILNGVKPRDKFFELATPKDLEAIKNAITEGDILANEGKIGYLTQALKPSQDPLGLVKAVDYSEGGKTPYFDIKRIIGRTTPKELASKFDKSIKYQLDTLNQANKIEDVLGTILSGNKFEDVPLGLSNLDQLPKGKVLLSPTAIQDALHNSFRNGRVDIKNILRSGTNKITDDAVMVDKTYINAIENALTPVSKGADRKALNAFKKSALASLNWIMGNRYGNVSNNMIEGVTASDYLDTRKYKDLLPKQLKYNTSYGSYIQEGPEGIINKVDLLDTSKQGWNEILRGVDEFKASEKGLKDIGGLASSLYSGSSDIVANPFFRMESYLEMKDRFANFIRQAKRYGEENNMKVEDVLKKAGKNDKLFNQLNDKVNKSLGDYIGRNYAMPNKLYDALSEWSPFYRFAFQTARTTGNQLANNPLAFNAIINAPSKYGKQLADEMINKYGFDPETYQGGVPYKQMGDGSYRTFRMQPIPLASILEGGMGMSPYATMVSDILGFRRGLRDATSSEREKLKEVDKYKAQKGNYEPSLKEVLALGGNTLMGNTNALYRALATYLPEAVATSGVVLNEINPELRKKLGIAEAPRYIGRGQFDTVVGLNQPYDTNIFEPNPYAYIRTLPSEMVGKWFGVQPRTGYKKFETNVRTQRKNARSLERKRVNINKENKGR